MDTRLRRYTPPIRQNISFYINHHEEVELSDGESWTQDTFIGSRNKDVCVWNKESNVCFVLCKASTAPLGYKILPLFCLCYKYTKKQKIEANTPCLLNTHRIKRQNQPKGYPKHASPSARICAMLEQKRKNDDGKKFDRKNKCQSDRQSKSKNRKQSWSRLVRQQFQCFNTKTLHMVRL